MPASTARDHGPVSRDIECAVRRIDWLPAPVVEGAGSWPGVLAALRTRAARRWYVGALAGITFAVVFMAMPLLRDKPAIEAGLWITLLALFCLAFLASVPVAMALPETRRWVPPTALFLLSLAFLGEFGGGVTGLWIYVVVSFSISVMNRRVTILVVFVLAALSLLMNALDPIDGTPNWTLPLLTLTTGILMMTFAENIKTVRLLQATRDELAQLAVEEERNRVGRDMHDILGHSLSAIALKSDLAAKLAELDPAAAAAEIGEVQALARSTLGDLRAVVSGYRQVRVASELASLRSLLPSAGIASTLPPTTDEVPERNRELFGWVLREAATNVIRHSGAKRCWVTLHADLIRVEDDGTGPGTGGSTSGNGLSGLSERVRDAGGTITLGRSRHGGFLVEVRA